MNQQARMKAEGEALDNAMYGWRKRLEEVVPPERLQRMSLMIEMDFGITGRTQTKYQVAFVERLPLEGEPPIVHQKMEDVVLLETAVVELTNRLTEQFRSAA